MSSYQRPLVSNVSVEGSIDIIINSLQNLLVSKKYSFPTVVYGLKTIEEVDEEEFEE